jgi:acetone carboxylase gamma subunit
MLTKWRDEFIAEATQAGITWEDARAILSKAKTLQRLAEAQCNGDWPADNGERETKECERCGCFWHPSVIKRNGCPDCRTQDKVKAILGRYAPVIQPDFQGDPRGCVVKLITPTREIGVPS